MRMHSPSRPGDMVGNMIEELEITVTGAAKHLGVTRQTLNNLINNDTRFCVARNGGEVGSCFWFHG